MSKAPEVRAYTMADADLKQKGDDLKSLLQRDAAEFAKRNVGQPRVDSLAALITSFDDTTTDEELRGLVTAATEVKDAYAEKVRLQVRTIRNMADQQYHSGGRYNTFGFNNMHDMSDDELYRMAKRVARVAKASMADLQQQGLTAIQLNNLVVDTKMLDQQIDEVGTAVENRDMETQDRIMKGNALWAEMISLASIGQSIFADTNEAKYNDYIMNDTPPTTAPAPVAGK